MPKYKVGDVAALFPKPSAAKTDTGKKIQSLFDDFYKNSNKLNISINVQVEQKKNQINNTENNSESPRKSKKKKRKHVDVDDNVSNSQDAEETQTKKKKPKLAPAQQNLNETATQKEGNYFPRNKKKSKHFNSIKENASTFPMMHFDEGEDEDFSQFDSQDQQPKNQKKKKTKKFSQTEIGENKEQGGFKNKSSKKMAKFLNSRNQNAEVELTPSDTDEKSLEIKQSPEKKSKKKKNRKQNKAKIVHDDVIEQEMPSDPENMEVLNENDNPKSKVKSKKNKKLLSAENNVKQNSETDKSLAESKESSKVISGKKIVKKKPMESAERLSRTLFVGNLPVGLTRQALQKLFSPFGPIEACRLRGHVPVKATIPKKVAAIKNEHHSGQKSFFGYVVFKDAKDATDALTLNGLLVVNHHIVVNPASSIGEKKTYDEKRSIFIGNLPFDIEDEAIWSAFSACGEIEAVRAIRDTETGAGKGFGYVLFKNIDSKETALKKNDIQISDRKIRIKEIISSSKKPNNKINAIKRKAKKLKGKQDGPNSRKSLKKLMNREKRNYQKKKIASIFKKFSS